MPPTGNRNSFHEDLFCSKLIKKEFFENWQKYFLRVRFIQEAISDLERDSCLKFKDITDFMDNYMKNYENEKLEWNYFDLESPPANYPDYL